MIETDVQITGLRELDDALAQFSDKVAKKALDNALSYAATPIVKEAKAKAALANEPHEMVYGRAGNKVTVQPGLLKSAIRKRRLKKRELSELGVDAGVAVYIGKGTKQKLYPKYWHFVEFGTSKIAPVPYLRPAFDTKANEAIERFKTKLRQNIEKEGGVIADTGGDE